MRKFIFVPALLLGLVCGFGSTAEAKSRGVSTFSGKAQTTLSYSSPVKMRSAADARCTSTMCGKPMAASDTERAAFFAVEASTARDKAGSRLGASSCASTFCGRTDR